jgi:hypothetical protein
MSDLFGVHGRQLLCHGSGCRSRGRGRSKASLRLIDELEREITDWERELRRLGADRRYVPLLCTVPGISWVLAYTIAAEIGDIARFPRKLAGYSGLCPRVTSPASATCAARSPRKVPLPALGAGRCPDTCVHRSRDQPFAPKGAHRPWPPEGPLRSCATGANSNQPCPPTREAIERRAEPRRRP